MARQQRIEPPMSFSLLVVEDDEKIAANLREVFSREGYDITLASSGEDGFFSLTTEHFDMLVLDLGLPGRSGFEILDAVRLKNKELPVLILSARDDVMDRVNCLRAGADDYLTKPFNVAELLARTEAILRRGRSDTVLRLRVGDLFMDLVTRKASRAGRPLDLTVRELELLEYLMRHSPNNVSRDMLAKDVWKEVNRVTPLDNVIDVHIARLRKKLDNGHSSPLIHTVRGLGFCLSKTEPL
jgi:two-component system, OmpR family, copper resistance phosphate regulon response regulator CusR